MYEPDIIFKYKTPRRKNIIIAYFFDMLYNSCKETIVNNILFKEIT